MSDIARRALTVRGVVQGVGFRPFVHGLAHRLRLRGFVMNRADGVLIEVEGEPCALDRFEGELSAGPPLPARVEAVSSAARAPRGDAGFRIAASEPSGERAPCIAPDLATCDDCLGELFDPGARRYRYPFVSCARCGPRLTIVSRAPYDRERTTMAPFAMCAGCRAEYDDAGDWRFHAQPLACAACGPRLRLLDARGAPVAAADPIARCAAAIREGGIVALKGLGGYHLACDARAEAAVAELRRRKERSAKPLAVMVADVASAEALCAISPEERELLRSPARPIVLLRQRPGARVAASVAAGGDCVDGAARLGIMLPYTPVHHLLLRELGAPLVMTSGNREGEPIACDDDEARLRLSGIADLVLAHDRRIALRCDDSVVEVAGGAVTPLRRSRGYAPVPIDLPVPLSCPTLALGGHLKAAFALGEGRRAVLSPHLGDLDGFEACQAYAAAVSHHERLHGVAPSRLVHDLHPDYATTRYAIERAGRDRIELIAVQHHHAHMASCMAEHGLTGPAIGVCFDGAGLGDDGAIWGGEFLVGGLREVARAAHLDYVGMPGGERAMREPWRMAVAHLRSAGEDVGSSPIARRVPAESLRVVERMLERSFNAPRTSSVGRLFDAVGAIVGAGDVARFEGDVAARLQALAAEAPAGGAYPFDLREDAGAMRAAGERGAVSERKGIAIDVRPLVRAVSRDVRDGVPRQVVARRFHSAIVDLVAAVCAQIRERTGVSAVALSGGVFANAILAAEVPVRLAQAGFQVVRHRLAPPNDGGLSLGQLAVAAARDALVEG